MVYIDFIFELLMFCRCFKSFSPKELVSIRVFRGSLLSFIIAVRLTLYHSF